MSRSDPVSVRPADPLGSAEAELLRVIADHLIPAAHGMPSAADVVGGDRLQFVLAARPDLVAPLRAALRSELGAEPAPRIARLAADEPVQHMALHLVIVGAYYTDATVRDLLGYPGQLAKPVNAHEYPEYVAEGLVDAVVARGPIWRDPDQASQGRP